MNGLLYVRSVRGRLCGGSGILLGWVIIAAFFGFFCICIICIYILGFVFNILGNVLKIKQSGDLIYTGIFNG